MGQHVRLGKSGALQLPPDLLAKRGWAPGMEFEVSETLDGLTVRAVRSAAPAAEGIDIEEFRRRVPKYQGPPKTLEDMQRGIDEAMAERWARKEANSQ